MSDTAPNEETTETPEETEPAPPNTSAPGDEPQTHDDVAAGGPSGS